MREAVDAWLPRETKNTTCRLEKSWVSRIWTPLFNREYIYLNEKSRTAWAGQQRIDQRLDQLSKAG
jgi:hypothetical protein